MSADRTPKKNKDGYTTKQAAFLNEYLVDLNATQAAIRAGYSKKTARIQAAKMLSQPNIQGILAAKVADRERRTEITQDMVVKELAKLGFSNMLDYIEPQEDGMACIDLSKLTRDQAACITEVHIDQVTEKDGDSFVPVRKIRFKLADKKGPLELLGKHLQMFNDINLKHSGGIKLTVSDGDEDL